MNDHDALAIVDPTPVDLTGEKFSGGLGIHTYLGLRAKGGIELWHRHQGHRTSYIGPIFVEHVCPYTD